jgi:hypothetical protein
MRTIYVSDKSEHSTVVRVVGEDRDFEGSACEGFWVVIDSTPRGEHDWNLSIEEQDARQHWVEGAYPARDSFGLAYAMTQCLDDVQVFHNGERVEG